MDFLFIVARVLLGGFFIMNGYNHIVKSKGLIGYAASKKVPQPKAAVLVTGIMLLLGGLGIVFWTNIDVAVLLLSVYLIVTSFVMHAFWAEKDVNVKMMEYVAFTKNIALLGAVLTLLAI